MSFTNALLSRAEEELNSIQCIDDVSSAINLHKALNKSIVVKKFGGTSLATIDLIKQAANIVYDAYQDGYMPIVVVSAMAGVTNSLLSMCRDITSIGQSNLRESLREYDATLSTGEVVSAGLFALALREIGLNAISLQGWQLPIVTNGEYANAIIDHIDTDLLDSYLKRDIVPVITGFQGVCANHITTLGRGGSDTSAVALAVAVDAIRCDIYTDVDGIYTTDPRMVSEARLIANITYEELLELAGNGAKVVHPRAVEIAMKFGVYLRVISTFTKAIGTNIMSTRHIESDNIVGISYIKNLCCVMVSNVSIDQNNISYKTSAMHIALKHIVDCGINPYRLLTMSDNTIRFCIDKFVLEQHVSDLAKHELEYDILENLASVTLVGSCIKHNAVLLSNIFDVLGANDIDVLFVSSNEMKISIVILESLVDKAVKLLHRFV